MKHLFLAAVLAAVTTPALAGPELITNGDFSRYTVGGAASTESYIVQGGQTSGKSTGSAVLEGWGNTAYSFVFQPNNVSSPGAKFNGNPFLGLWGPGGTNPNANYSNNGLVASPTGGAFLASDGSYQQGYVYQTLNGLGIGQAYNLSFYWAAAQQAGFSGVTTEAWNVYWADKDLNVVGKAATETVTTPNHGFTPWRQAAYQFVATTSTMTLAFLAVGTPGGSPPFSLLDGVSLTAAPEPATWAILVTGLVGITLVRMRRQAM